jgi:hypothetical protein
MATGTTPSTRDVVDANSCTYFLTMPNGIVRQSLRPLDRRHGRSAAAIHLGHITDAARGGQPNGRRRGLRDARGRHRSAAGGGKARNLSATARAEGLAANREVGPSAGFPSVPPLPGLSTPPLRSGVLRFAPPLRVTAPSPVAGGPDWMECVGGLACASTPRSARAFVRGRRPQKLWRGPPSTCGGPLKSPAGRASTRFRTEDNHRRSSWVHGGSSPSSGRGSCRRRSRRTSHRWSGSSSGAAGDTFDRCSRRCCLAARRRGLPPGCHQRRARACFCLSG